MSPKRDMSFVPCRSRETHVVVTCPCACLHRRGALFLLLEQILHHYSCHSTRHSYCWYCCCSAYYYVSFYLYFYYR